MAGEKIEILLAEIRLVLGLRDVLLLRNHDDVPQIFGPTLIMPGQSFRLPFDVASEYLFTCTAHVSGQMKVVVDEEPNTPWTRLRWRATLPRTASPPRRRTAPTREATFEPAKILPPLVLIALLLATWWGVVLANRSAIFPTPRRVDGMREPVVDDGSLWGHIERAASPFRVGTGFSRR
ncbi:MAG: hypothetical protein U0166_29375 [Acidobacteriota bacterium]